MRKVAIEEIHEHLLVWSQMRHTKGVLDLGVSIRTQLPIYVTSLITPLSFYNQTFPNPSVPNDYKGDYSKVPRLPSKGGLVPTRHEATYSGLV